MGEAAGCKLLTPTKVIRSRTFSVTFELINTGKANFLVLRASRICMTPGLYIQVAQNMCAITRAWQYIPVETLPPVTLGHLIKKPAVGIDAYHDDCSYFSAVSASAKGDVMQELR